MKRLLGTALGALLVLGTAAIAQQEEEPAKPGGEEMGQAAPEGELRELTLTVVQTNPKEHSVVFKAQVKPEASIMKEGRSLQIDQLRPGDEVRASFDPLTGDIQKIEVTRAAPPAQKKEKKGTTTP